MPFSLDIYYRRGNLEPSITVFVPLNIPDMGEYAAGLAIAFSALQTTSVVYTRWELKNEAGVRVLEGAFDDVTGQAGGEMQPFKYCVHLRMVAAGEVERPSTKYIHGYSIELINDGEPSIGTLAAVDQIGAYLASVGVLNSDGQLVTDLVFRSFTRRSKVRRVP